MGNKTARKNYKAGNKWHEQSDLKKDRRQEREA